jgi:hypothetical protein
MGKQAREQPLLALSILLQQPAIYLQQTLQAPTSQEAAVAAAVAAAAAAVEVLHWAAGYCFRLYKFLVLRRGAWLTLKGSFKTCFRGKAGVL